MPWSLPSSRWSCASSCPAAARPKARPPRERLPSLPDVPTFAQAGQPGFELAVWHGLYAPRGTPQAVIERLNKSLRTALSEPALVKRFTDMSVIIPPAGIC